MAGLGRELSDAVGGEEGPEVHRAGSVLIRWLAAARTILMAKSFNGIPPGGRVAACRSASRSYVRQEQKGGVSQ